MDRESVKLTEESEPEQETGLALLYQAELFGEQVGLGYMFDEGKLFAGMYDGVPTHLDSRIIRELTRRYGSAKTTSPEKREGLYWETEHTRISLGRYTHAETFFLFYESKVLAEELRQRTDAEAPL